MASSLRLHKCTSNRTCWPIVQCHEHVLSEIIWWNKKKKTNSFQLHILTHSSGLIFVNIFTCFFRFSHSFCVCFAASIFARRRNTFTMHVQFVVGIKTLNAIRWCNCKWYCYANIPSCLRRHDGADEHCRWCSWWVQRIALQVSRSYSSI